ncbi:putative transcriptional regulator, TetR family protein [Actinoplanes sp. NBRC 14428]|uniref:TetR family transcriptional regulator n=1 Tax=Pseudosporangium ferrugineum TaxID=439699 RepID=A0A2T0S894_9ACTN|nr:TetR/AcrR family transcriptional regulator [Pseudosporangium ferrugineum]PRY29615.1 TetR family transcriptional regulator [Pseudosporangium ferrugineum]BCJ52633.1 putative transcriptional regulator, TetR family protein [Actinoplanes sp. NBRC 14428]
MSAASPPALRRPSARDRLLAAADELFYAEGVHTVGIDRVIERAGVAKASLYSCFGNKEGLVRAYLEGRHRRRQERFRAGLERFTTPRDRLLGVFDVLAEQAAAANFRGCAFYNASAESTGGAVQEVSDTSRAWTRGLLTELARDAGAPDPAGLADRLVILYDGSTVGARMDRSPAAATTARVVAEALLDAALAAGRA